MKKHVIERQQRNRELGQQHAAKTCAFCKSKPVAQFWAPFCSETCQDDNAERQQIVRGMR